MLTFPRFCTLLITVLLLTACATSPPAGSAGATITIDGLRPVAEVDPRFSSYNVEMAEVVGGDFWIPYAEMDTSRGPGEFTELGEDTNRFRYRAPVDLSNRRLRTLAAALSPAFVRVSGSWANATYFHGGEGPPPATPPEGFKYVLTRGQWDGVQDFARATGADLMVSFAITDGTRDGDGRWAPDQAAALIDYTKVSGGKIDAVQFFNEPNMPTYAGAPEGYTGADFAADVAVFTDFIHRELPGVPVAGPDAVGEGGLIGGSSMPGMVPTDSLLAGRPRPDFDVFAYHHYGGVSRRCATTAPMHSPFDSALTKTWLDKTLQTYQFYVDRRDRYLSGLLYL